MSKENKRKQLQFRTVAGPEEVYKKIKELAASEERTIARQLGILIKTAHMDLGWK